MARNILLINGPNLNLLGIREPHIYGTTTLEDVVSSARAQAQELNVALHDFQSNHEGGIIDRIHEARGNVVIIIINPGAYTHTSVAIRDALLGVEIPFIEIHLTVPHSREKFRHHSYLSDKAAAVICGMGAHGYSAALTFAASHLTIKRASQ
ncbi:Dehydroquinase [Pestalotiopsis sp. NC0098]|nr:Dehydroquinase [Pestalotiopsis sp. NC0098]